MSIWESQETDASKVALNALCQKIDKIGGDFIDCQIPTEHLKSMGAVEIRRDEFLSMVKEALEIKSYFGIWS